MVVNGLDADNGGDAKDIVGIGSTRNVGCRTVQTKEHVTVGVGASNQPSEFAGDVGGIKVREDQDVCVAAQFAVGQFAGGNLGNHRGVHLELAVEVRLDLSLQGLMFGQRGGSLDFAHRGVAAAPLGGEREERHPRA